MSHRHGLGGEYYPVELLYVRIDAPAAPAQRVEEEEHDELDELLKGTKLRREQKDAATMAAEAKARAAAEKAKAAEAEAKAAEAEKVEGAAGGQAAAPRPRSLLSKSFQQHRARENAEQIADTVAGETRVPCPVGELTGHRHYMIWKPTGDRLPCDLEFRSKTKSHEVCLMWAEAGAMRCECPCTPRDELLLGMNKPPGIVLCMECAREQAVDYSEDEENGE